VLLEVHDLYSGYGEMEILHGVSMTLDQGELVTIIGPNGAGKLTLIKTIFGLLKPKKGQITLRGTDITGLDPRSLVLKGLTYVPQLNNTFPTLSVMENLEMGAISHRKSPIPLVKGRARSSETAFVMMNDAQIRKRARQVIELFPNLGAKVWERAGSLSGGEQQMVALAKSLMIEPEILLVDEPSAGLAPKLVDMVFAKIREINERGTAVALVEQNAKKALALANRGYVLEMGRNRFEDTGQGLLHNTDVARMYLGG